MSADSPSFAGIIGETYKDSTPWWPAPRAAPPGAPNIVFVVLDDVGFADLGCYGSEIRTPNIDRLAANGLRYSNFHVTAMCSPTRACLLTGRNAHAVGMGIIAEWSSGFPGYQGRISRRAATIPEVLRDHAYGTYAIGKWHLTNIADYGAAGPHGDWPLGRGFDRWYGFHGALTDQWHPDLYQDNRPIHLAPRDGYHLSTDLVDHAIGDIRDHLTSAPARPFLAYVAFGACHWPHHVPKRHIEANRGRYDRGWDEIRAERLRQQIALGVVPPSTTLAPLNAGVSAWRDLAPDVRKLCARLQETYAAFLEHTDAEIGRLVDYLSGVGHLDDTLLVLLSDNGASAEGGPTGAINLRKHMVYEEESPEVGLSRLEAIGGPQSFNHYPTGWAQVSNTPLKWYKKDTHGGGIRAPLILHWPKRLARPGTLRHQYHHVVDVAPTIYELLGLNAPTEYLGVPQIPIHGISMAYTFGEPETPTRKEVQYFEILGDRAIWHRGWKAVTHHPKGANFDADRWELYHLDHDFAEIDDLATNEPDRLKAMIELWWSEARKYDVAPLDDRDWERAAARLKMRTPTRYEFWQDMARVDRLSAPDITDRSYVITAEFDVASRDAEGVLLSWGSRFGGFVLFMANDNVCYEYVYSESIRHTLRAPWIGSEGRHVIRLRFDRAGNGAAAALLVDGKQAAATRIPKTWPTHGTTTGLNCGHDAGSPVSDSYPNPFPFTGHSLKVTIDLEDRNVANGGAAYRAALREQ